MRNLIAKTIRTTFSGFGNALLTTTAIGITTLCIGLAALYLLKHLEETPEIIKLHCLLGISHVECPAYRHEMDELEEQKLSLEEQLQKLLEQSQKAESKLHNLRRVESSVDEVTLFAAYDDPHSSLMVTVGTVYSKLVEPDSHPQHFCYFTLGMGKAGEQRNLHFYSRNGSASLSDHDIYNAGISKDTLDYARSVCKPTLIGSGQ